MFRQATHAIQRLPGMGDELPQRCHTEVQRSDSGVQQQPKISGRQPQRDVSVFAHAVGNKPVGAGAAPILEIPANSLSMFAQPFPVLPFQSAIHSPWRTVQICGKTSRTDPQGQHRRGCRQRRRTYQPDQQSQQDADPWRPFQVHVDGCLTAPCGLSLGGCLPLQQFVPGDENPQY